MLYRICVELLRPYPLLIFFLLGVQIFLWRQKMISVRLRWALLLPTLLLWLFSMPLVSFFFAATLEWAHPPIYQRPQGIDAIVILGSGVAPPDSMRKKAELDITGMLRCLKAVELYHAGSPCPVVVTGGRVASYKTGPVMAAGMRDLVISHGVAAEAVSLEDQSRSTYENAIRAIELLQARDIDSALIVTDATHLNRALGCFRSLGMDAHAGGCNYKATKLYLTPSSFLPSAGAAALNQVVFHEWLGLFYYRLRGRI
ncbi:MAG: YdcF family protein [Pirellulales bacterium]|nr:YdcF family protein [Pirellulales bacterium]